MSKEKIKQLSDEIEKINLLVSSLEIPRQILDKEVKSFGNGGHIILPKSYLNKKVKVILS